MVQGGSTYGATVVMPQASGLGTTRSRKAARVGVLVLCIGVVATVALAWGKGSAVELLADTTDNDALLHSERQGIHEEQQRLSALDKQASEESRLAIVHSNNGEQEALLAGAARSKAAANKQVAAALLATVKQHTAQLAKIKEEKLADADKEKSEQETAKAQDDDMHARAAQQRANQAKAQEHKYNRQVSSAQHKLAALEHKEGMLEQSAAEQKLAAKRLGTKVAEDDQLISLSTQAAKAMKHRSVALKHKAARLAKRMEELREKAERRNLSAEKSMAKSKKDAQRAAEGLAKKRGLAAQARKTKSAVESEQLMSENLTDQLAKQREIVHARTNELSHMKARRHEAKTALERARHHLKEAERRIYLKQVRDNGSDPTPSDADLGLV